MTRSYLIPSTNITPDEDYCLKVYIPKNTDYLINFFTALSHFGKWVAWKENGTDNAKAVADRWKISIEATHTAWAESGGCVEFRINPDTCLLEVQCGETWQPVYTPAFDPTNDTPFNPPYPDDPPVGQTNECIAATNIVAMMQESATNFADLIIGGGVLGAIVAFLYEVFNNVVTIPLELMWGTVTQQVDGFDAGTMAADLAGFDWDGLTDYIACLLSSDGSITPGQWNAAIEQYQSEYAADGNQIWLYLAMTWGIMGTVGLAYASHWGGIATGDCAVCGAWEIDHDFTLGQHGWEIMYNAAGGTPPCESGAMGSYVPSEGFRAEFEPSYGSIYSAYQVMIRFPIGAAICESIDIYWSSGDYVDYVRVGSDNCNMTYSQPNPAGTSHHFDVGIHDGYIHVAILGDSSQPLITRVAASGTGELP